MATEPKILQPFIMPSDVTANDWNKTRTFEGIHIA
jgi:hypothetical protein